MKKFWIEVKLSVINMFLFIGNIMENMSKPERCGFWIAVVLWLGIILSFIFR